MVSAAIALQSGPTLGAAEMFAYQLSECVVFVDRPRGNTSGKVIRAGAHEIAPH